MFIGVLINSGLCYRSAEHSRDCPNGGKDVDGVHHYVNCDRCNKNSIAAYDVGEKIEGAAPFFNFFGTGRDWNRFTEQADGIRECIVSGSILQFSFLHEIERKKIQEELEKICECECNFTLNETIKTESASFASHLTELIKYLFMKDITIQ